MLLVNVDDVLKITNSPIRHENASMTTDDLTFFDTDKFIANLSNLKKGTQITSDMLSAIFTDSFTTGHIDWNRD